MNRLLIVIAALSLAPCGYAEEDSLKVKITPSLEQIVVRHGETPVTIMRQQEPSSTLSSLR